MSPSLYTLVLYMAVGSAAVIIFFAGAFLIEPGSGMKVKALAVLVLLTAVLSYLGIYLFEVSNDGRRQRFSCTCFAGRLH